MAKGDEVEVVLDSQRYKVGNYKVSEVPALANQIRSGQLTQRDRQADYETVAPQATWHDGYGIGEIQDDNDLGRYHYSQNIDARIKGQLILGPAQNSTSFTTGGDAEAIQQFIEFNGSWFGIATRRVFKWNGTTWDTDKDMGATAAGKKNAATVFANALYVGAGGAVDFWMRDTSGTWSQPAAGIKAEMMAIVGSTLWRIFSANQLSSSTNGTTWLTAVAVGDSNKTATLLSDYNGNPHIGKPEGLFEYDGTTVRNRLAELGYRLSSTNCKGGKPSRGKMFLPVGPALWQYTADAVQTEGKPTRSADVLAAGISKGSASEVRGSIVELWPDVDFLWGILRAESGNYYMIAYDYNPVGGKGWHQVAKLGTTAVASLGRFQDSSGNPRVWYSEGTSAPKYVVLPLSAINPYVDSSYTYAPNGDIYLPIEADVFDDVNKAYLAYKFEVDNVTANRYIELLTSIDGAAEVFLKKITTSGLNSIFFPSTAQGRRISLHIRMTTDDTTQTPRVLPFSRHFQLRFERKKIWEFVVKASRGSLANVQKTALRQLVALESARDSVIPVEFKDKDGRLWTVFVQALGNIEAVIDEDSVNWEVPVKLVEWRSGIGVFRYNSSSQVFDDRARWSNGSDNNQANWS